MAQAVTYVATSPKSNAAYLAVAKAMEDVEEKRTIPVPMHLRSTAYPGAERLGHGKGYRYAHDGEGHFVVQDYLGVEKLYYEPTGQGHEARIGERLQAWRKLRRAGSSAVPAVTVVVASSHEFVGSQ